MLFHEPSSIIKPILSAKLYRLQVTTASKFSCITSLTILKQKELILQINFTNYSIKTVKKKIHAMKVQLVTYTNSTTYTYTNYYTRKKFCSFEYRMFLRKFKNWILICINIIDATKNE